MRLRGPSRVPQMVEGEAEGIPGGLKPLYFLPFQDAFRSPLPYLQGRPRPLGENAIASIWQ